MKTFSTHTSAIDRRRLVIWTLALPFVAGVGAAHSETTKTIDRRVRSEDRNYGLTFAAELPSGASIFGHAFILWQREDEAKRMSISEAIGFYPTGDPSNLDLIFGTSGALETDIGTATDLKLTVLLNSDLYETASSRKREWEADGHYTFLWNNCVGHVADIATAIGLNTGAGHWESPQDYVHALINSND